MTADLLATLADLDTTMTPGPWLPDPWGVWVGRVGGDGTRLYDSDEAVNADATGVATLRNLIPELRARLERADRDASELMVLRPVYEVVVRAGRDFPHLAALAGSATDHPAAGIATIQRYSDPRLNEAHAYGFREGVEFARQHMRGSAGE